MLLQNFFLNAHVLGSRFFYFDTWQLAFEYVYPEQNAKF